ncbi:hypothetical protein LOTGIDRAFT_173657 [Lottia gigantea]|uniref:Uncharacterized protein n=1 Tax=Lottia gigantea TaxID=225164 RepID=V4A6T9_LOTGI|nr:hypothetical protein LOTGIDRAFT_173657 [Lottia gigantea]ESO99648.1 hypothetical protein LOTGIDRAFT_173657 [Lottia gigantea]
MTDDIILGLDFLAHHKCIINIDRPSVQIGNDIIYADLQSYSNKDDLSEVLVSKRVTIPPNSVIKGLSDYQGYTSKFVDLITNALKPEVKSSNVNKHGRKRKNVEKIPAPNMKSLSSSRMGTNPTCTITSASINNTDDFSDVFVNPNSINRTTGRKLDDTTNGGGKVNSLQIDKEQINRNELADLKNQFAYLTSIDLVDPQEMYDKFLEETPEVQEDDFNIPKIFQGNDTFGNPVSDNLVKLVSVATTKKVEVSKLTSKILYTRKL